MDTKVKWQFDADYLQACSCDYGCPCEFNAPPTTGFCDGLGAWRIGTGRYGDLSLDGLGLGFVAHWPKALHEGNGTACVFVDEKASPAQREALLHIASGQAGGLPFEIIAVTLSKLLEPQFVPFHFEFKGPQSRLKMGQAVVASFAPILNPVTHQPESLRIEHGTGFMFKSADAISAEEMHAKVGELSFSWPKKAGFVTHVKYAN